MRLVISLSMLLAFSIHMGLALAEATQPSEKPDPSRATTPASARDKPNLQRVAAPEHAAIDYLAFQVAYTFRAVRLHDGVIQGATNWSVEDPASRKQVGKV